LTGINVRAAISGQINSNERRKRLPLVYYDEAARERAGGVKGTDGVR
jgi:hypothetical protein